MDIKFKTLLNLFKLSNIDVYDITYNSFSVRSDSCEKVDAILARIGYVYNKKENVFLRGQHRIFSRKVKPTSKFRDYAHLNIYTFEV